MTSLSEETEAAPGVLLAAAPTAGFVDVGGVGLGPTVALRWGIPSLIEARGRATVLVVDVVVEVGDITDFRTTVDGFPSSGAALVALDAVGFGGSVGRRVAVVVVVEVVVVDDGLGAAVVGLLGTVVLTPGETIFVAVDELLVDFLSAIDDADLTAPLETVDLAVCVGLASPAPNVPELIICICKHLQRLHYPVKKCKTYPFHRRC